MDSKFRTSMLSLKQVVEVLVLGLSEAGPLKAFVAAGKRRWLTIIRDPIKPGSGRDAREGNIVHLDIRDC